MAFTTSFFFLGILPLFIFLYSLKKESGVSRKLLLCITNSLFVVWAGADAFFFICLYIGMIYFLGACINKLRKKWMLCIAIILAVGPLVMVKNIIFVLRQIDATLGLKITIPSVIVPIGISFITFEAVSLLVDIHNGLIKKISLLDTYLYLTFFPTITSGPLLRYSEFVEGLYNKSFKCDYTIAINRIAYGLCKKILLADKISILADYYFNGVAAGNSYSWIGLWIGAISYTLQLYFDFSGYSDMAIGIGMLMGFEIKENFNRPYQASSISDFWTRWHISLTRWFRDYIYIPLGGNRCSKKRHLLNMLIVWLLTGIWHGADVSFIVWGLGYYILLVFEKYQKPKLINVFPLNHIYTLFFVNLLWVPFRAANMNVTIKYLQGMFCVGGAYVEQKAIRFIPLLFIMIALCLPLGKTFAPISTKKWFCYCKNIIIIIMVFLSICGIINSSFTPYIYGNF